MADEIAPNSITGAVDNNSLDNTDPLNIKGLPRYNYPFPVSPRNFRVYFAYDTGSFDLYWDSPLIDPKNSVHAVQGVNIYRSIDSSEGPWTLVNQSPIQVNFFRDESRNTIVTDEIVTSGRLSLAENKAFARTENKPLVVSKTDQTYVFNSSDITAKIDGKTVEVKNIEPQTGEIEFHVDPVWDPVFERFINFPVPTDQTEIKLTYTYNALFLQEYNNIDQRIFYKITSVTSEKETPLDNAPLGSYQDLDSMFYIWKNAISKQKFMLDQGGEEVNFFIQKSAGDRCDNHDIVDRNLYDDTVYRSCPVCYGTGFIGGYLGPFKSRMAPFDASSTYNRTNKGSKRTKTQSTWIINSPVLRQGDVLLRQNGERYIIGPVQRKEPNGVLVQQNFDVHILQPTDILYKVTVPGVPSIYPKPDKPNIPDYKESKGKSPTFGNWERS